MLAANVNLEEGLAGWSDRQREVTDMLMPIAVRTERSLVFEARGARGPRTLLDVQVALRR